MILGAGYQQDLQGFSIIHVVQYDLSEMQKAADAADISVLFFSAGANFWAILGHFWAILAILGNFWAILGNFRSFLGHFLVLIFLWQNMHLCYLNRFCNSVVKSDHFHRSSTENDQNSIIPRDLVH